MTYKKKLIEVALPLEAINKASAREKSIRHGHPSTLHLWWARRPLAAARAVIWASLVDDPSAHPNQFPTEEAQNKERQRLFKILEDLVIWENSNNEDVLNKAKAEILKSTDGNPPPLLDPFAGGGAIPLEAQRLGLKAYASDLNPVAVMINKAMIEIPPKFANQPPVNPEARAKIGTAQAGWQGASGLAEDVRYYGEWMKQEAFKRIGHLYPTIKDEQGIDRTVIAWIWARTVKCPNPACGIEMPLANSFVVSSKKGNEAWVEPIVDEDKVTFKVHKGKCPKDKQSIKIGRGAAFKCVSCGTPADPSYVRGQFVHKKNDSQLMAIVAEGNNGRLYLAPTEEHVLISKRAKPAWTPEEEMNQDSPNLVSGRGYGITHWKELFTNRQLTALTTFSDLVKEAQSKVEQDALKAGLSDDAIGLTNGGIGAKSYGEAISVYLTFMVEQLANHSSSICGWNSPNQQMRAVFARQAIPMVWDYAESNVFSESSGSYKNLLDRLIKAFYSLGISEVESSAWQSDARVNLQLKDFMVSTDPPYYDNIAYGDLSDFFYVWMRQSLKDVFPELFSTLLVPKVDELVATPYRFAGGYQEAKEYFENGMVQAFKQISTYVNSIPVTVYYAFKQSETEKQKEGVETSSTGWEAMLSALINSGFSITGTWPMRTEKPGRMIEWKTNALASSIVLVCRKREENASTITRREFINQLKQELQPALSKLQESNIAPVDMAQAAIGPGMGVYSRYAQVLEADGTPMSVRTALQIINQELDSFFNEQDGELDSASRFCVDLFTQSAFNEIRYGEADVLARAKNTSVEGLAEDGVLLAEKGIVRLLTREELPAFSWAKKGMVWMLTQQLTKAMETGGYQATAEILAALPASKVEQAKALAYRLFSLADRKGWAKEAYAYNTLVSSWQNVQSTASEIAKTASEPKQINWLEENQS